MIYETAIDEDPAGKAHKLATADICTTVLSRFNEVQAIASDPIFQKKAKAAIRGKDQNDQNLDKDKELDVIEFLDWIVKDDEAREHADGGAILTTHGHTRTWVPGAEPRAGDSVKMLQDKQTLQYPDKDFTTISCNWCNRTGHVKAYCKSKMEGRAKAPYYYERPAAGRGGGRGSSSGRGYQGGGYQGGGYGGRGGRGREQRGRGDGRGGGRGTRGAHGGGRGVSRGRLEPGSQSHLPCHE